MQYIALSLYTEAVSAGVHMYPLNPLTLAVSAQNKGKGGYTVVTTIQMSGSHYLTC